MILVDSHCHLDLITDHGDITAVLKRANDIGVKYFLCVCISQQDFAKMQAVVKGRSNIFLSVGTHPNEKVEQEPTVEEMCKLALTPSVVAIGETGLDYYRTQGDVSWQQARFRRHIQVAKATKKPLIVHSRHAREDTIRILEEENAQEVGGVLHCFTENWQMAQEAMALNFYISFSGIITFHNADELQAVVRQVPLRRMLIETDSPYLAPVPFRGKPNEPAYVRHVAEKIAQLKNVPLTTVACHTTQNFFNLFKAANL